MQTNGGPQLRHEEEAGAPDRAQMHYQEGRRYELGIGVCADPGAAYQRYRRAAMLGHPDAQNALGFLYATGHGVARNEPLAARWFMSAASRGHTGAQANLGTLYAEGRGLPQDDAEALRWYERAAEGGNPDAQEFLAKASREGLLGMRKDPAQAGFWEVLAVYSRAAAEDAARES